MRVVSLLPSATEILLTLTGEDAVRKGAPIQLVGRSHECDFPPILGHSDVPVLTAAKTVFTTSAAVDAAVSSQLQSGTSLYTLDETLLAELAPDVILTQDLCSVCSIDLAAVRAVAQALPKPPAVVSMNPTTFEGVLDDILMVGHALGLDRRALQCVVDLRGRAYRAEEFVNPYDHKPTLAFLEWTDPIFIGGHWTPQLIERAGAAHPLNPTVPNAAAGAGQGPIGQTQRHAGKSIRIPSEILAASRPDLLIVCPCGLSLEQAWAETVKLSQSDWWTSLPAVQMKRVAIVDGNQMFNRPGPRLVDALEFLVGFVTGRAEVIPESFPWRLWT